MTPDAVLFDFGDTLLHEGPTDFEAGATAVLARAKSRRCTPRELAAAMIELMRDIEPRRRAGLIEMPPTTVWRLIYDPLGLEFDVEPEDLEWIFWQAATSWEPEPAINDALATLERAGIPWGVLSNSGFRGPIIERQLKESGLRSSYSFVMASVDHVLRKPHPRLFTLAAARLGAAPATVWFVGDSYEFDVCGAAGAGMVPIWYRPSGEAEKPQPAARVIRSWAEFTELLDATRRL